MSRKRYEAETARHNCLFEGKGAASYQVISVDQPLCMWVWVWVWVWVWPGLEAFASRGQFS